MPHPKLQRKKKFGEIPICAEEPSSSFEIFLLWNNPGEEDPPWRTGPAVAKCVDRIKISCLPIAIGMVTFCGKTKSDTRRKRQKFG